MTAVPVLETRNVTKVFRPPPAPWRKLFGREPLPDVVALCDVSLQIHPGEILGLVGPNGAGKTALLKLIATLSEPTSGEVRVFGLDATRDSRTIRRRLGMATCDERSFYWRLTCRQNLTFFARLVGLDGARLRGRVGELFDLLDLADCADRPYRVLSTGNRQRLAIARALLQDPVLLLLDEPTNSLDPIAAKRLRALIAERIRGDGERAILVTSHNLEEVQDLSSRVAILNRGVLLETAGMSALCAKYASTERVTITTGTPLSDATWDALLTLVPTLRSESRNGEVRLGFDRKPGDETLNRVLAELIGSGCEIVGCETRAADLSVVFDKLVGRCGDA